MNSIKKSLLKVLLALFMISMLALLVTTQVFAVDINDVTFTGANFESEYVLDKELTLPDVKAHKGAQEYDTQKSLVFPDGSIKSVSKDTLSQAGKYYARYTALIDGFKYEKNYEFMVKENLYGMKLASGTATYDSTGDLIKLKTGGKNPFTFNSVVDLSDNDLNKPFIEIYNVSSRFAERDFAQLIVTLTDINDEENFLKIRINASPDFKKYPYTYYTSYVAVSINDGVYTGMQDGGRIHKGNQYGRAVRYSFSNTAWAGSPWEAMPTQDKFITPENDRLLLYYVAEDRAIYAYSTSLKAYGGLVVDFDSDEFYNDFWDGFSVDKCKVSVEASQMIGSTAELYITDIDGQDLSKTYVEDKVGPELDIDMPEILPGAIAGYEYKVFDYTAKDDYGVFSSSVSAYYNYYSSRPISVSIKNGKMYPKYEGVHTLVYRAVDAYGNLTEKLVNVYAEKANSASPLTLTVSENYANCLAGARVDLKNHEVVSDPKYGDYQVDISAVCGDYTATIKDGYFYANKVGTWKVIYKVTDDLGRSTVVEKTFTASANSTPVFGEHENLLPKYLLAGATYDVTEITAYKYGKDKTEEIKPSIKYTLNGQTVNVTNGTITPAYVNGQKNELKLIYYIGSVQYSVTSRVVEPLKGTTFNAGQLFYLAQGAATATLDNTGIIYNATETATVDFVSYLLDSKIETELTFLADGKLTVLLSDSKNNTQVVEVELVFSNGKIAVYLNGVRKQAFDAESLLLGISGDMLAIDSTEFRIRDYLDGQGYNGFSSRKILVSYVIESGTSIKISKVGNQPISNYAKDMTAPMGIQYGSLQLTYEKGTEIVLPRVFAYDIVCGETQVKLSVSIGDDKYLKTTDGKELKELLIDDKEIRFVASEYGYYTVEYVSIDGSGKKLVVSYSVNVLDDINPQITVNGKISDTAKVGEMITLPTAKVSDNISNNLKVTIFAINPSFGYQTVTNGKLTFNKAGKWTIRYFVIDQAGNMATVDYVVNVQEK